MNHYKLWNAQGLLCVCVCMCGPQLADVLLQRQSWKFLAPQMDHEDSDSLPLVYATSVVPYKPEARLFQRGKMITKVLMILRDPLSK